MGHQSFGQSPHGAFIESPHHARDKKPCILEMVFPTHSGQIDIRSPASTMLNSGLFQAYYAHAYTSPLGSASANLMNVMFWDLPQDFSQFNRIGNLALSDYEACYKYTPYTIGPAIGHHANIGVIKTAFDYHAATFNNLPAINWTDSIPIERSCTNEPGVTGREIKAYWGPMLLDTLFDSDVYAIVTQIVPDSPFPYNYADDCMLASTQLPYVTRLELP